jgi:hypothetical protein
VQITKSVFISFVTAGRTTNEVFEQWELESKHRPRFGRNWWFWLPSLHCNGGRFRRHENTDITLHWLCFSVAFTVYSRACRYNATADRPAKAGERSGL